MPAVYQERLERTSITTKSFVHATRDDGRRNKGTGKESSLSKFEE
jgi:hypothetical protein